MSAPNMICKYSKCNKPYSTCSQSVRLGHYKVSGCCFEHFAMYQNEVYYFRGEELPFPEFVDRMIKEGSLPQKELNEDINILNQN